MRILKFLALFALGILSCVIIVTAAEAATPTPTPTARIVCAKSAAVDGDTITWTLECTNTGNASQTVEVTDTLFAGPDWLIVPGSDSFGCALTGSNTAGANKLECAGEVPKRVRDQFDDVVDGRVSVQVQGDVSTCGKFSNTAHFFYGDSDHKASASAIVGCPATPVPTSAPTATPTSTSTPTASASTPTSPSTPASPVATSSARIAPGPPNTGNTSSVQEGEGLALIVAWIGVVAMAGAGLAYWLWRDYHR
jgi:hypothetical protein